MRGIVKIGFGLLLVLLVGGLAVAAVNKVRHAAAVTACGNNLKLIGRGLAAHHETWGRFPPGTFPNAGLPPEKRLGWLTWVWPFFVEGGDSHPLRHAESLGRRGELPSVLLPPRLRGGREGT
jgi:hypothetical protein